MGQDDCDNTTENSQPLPPNVKQCGENVRRQRWQWRREGGLKIDQNDDDGAVGSDFDGKLNKDDGRTQQAIWHGMVVTYDFFPSLYIRWGYGSDKLE